MTTPERNFIYKATADSKQAVTVINILSSSAAPPQYIIAPLSLDKAVQPETWTPKQVTGEELLKQYPVRHGQ